MALVDFLAALLCLLAAVEREAVLAPEVLLVLFALVPEVLPAVLLVLPFMLFPDAAVLFLAVDPFLAELERVEADLLLAARVLVERLEAVVLFAALEPVEAARFVVEVVRLDAAVLFAAPERAEAKVPSAARLGVAVERLAEAEVLRPSAFMAVCREVPLGFRAVEEAEEAVRVVVPCLDLVEEPDREVVPLDAAVFGEALLAVDFAVALLAVLFFVVEEEREDAALLSELFLLLIELSFLAALLA